MKLSNLFTRGVVTVKPETTLAAVALRMFNHKVGAIVVEDKSRPIGIITDRDLAVALAIQCLDANTHVSEVMTRHVLAIPDETDVVTATKYMRERRVRRLPIVDTNDELVGMVTFDDLVRYLGREISNLAHSIDDEVCPNLTNSQCYREELAGVMDNEGDLVR